MTNTEPMPLELLAEKIWCGDSHLNFTRRFFVPRMGFKFQVNWHHVYICEKLDAIINGTAKCRNIVFNVPPGAGKTELCGGNLVARGLAINPRARYLYLSYSEELVSDVLATAKNIVSSDEFQALWHIDFAKDTSAKRNWKTMVEGYYAGHAYGNSLGGQITGRRAGVLGVDGFSGMIVIDDPIKPEDAFSQPLRTKAVRKLINTVQSRKAHPDVPVVMIMQRLHVDDPTGAVEKNLFVGDWEIIKIPALIDDDYIGTLPDHIQSLIPHNAERDDKGRQSYWPEKESLAHLLQLEQGGNDKDGAAVSRYTMSSQYQQEPTKLGGGLIKTEYFGRYKTLPPLKWRAVWADTAQKTAQHNDFSVFLCAGLGYDNNLYLIDLVRGRWESPQLIAAAKAFFNKHRPKTNELGTLRRLYVEDKVSGTTLIQTIEQENDIPVVAIQRGTDKLTRFMDVQPFIEMRRVYLPEDVEQHPWVPDYLAECEAFTANMTHDFDDQIDPTIDAINETLVNPYDLFD